MTEPKECTCEVDMGGLGWELLHNESCPAHGDARTPVTMTYSGLEARVRVQNVALKGLEAEVARLKEALTLIRDSKGGTEMNNEQASIAIRRKLTGDDGRCRICGSDSVSSHGPADDPHLACDKCESTVVYPGFPGYVEPIDYNTPEGMVLLKAALREAGKRITTTTWETDGVWEHRCSVESGAHSAAFTEHEALFRAVCAACEIELGGE